MRKYEIYLPLNYNSGERIESTKITSICDELAATFGAITVSGLTTPYQGRWKYRGVEYVDAIVKVEIITSWRQGHKEVPQRLQRTSEGDSPGKLIF
jgi:hypothetical protein